MRGLADDAERSTRSSLSSELSVALGAAAAWAASDVARVDSPASVAVTFLSLLGSASLVLGIGVVCVRRARPFGDGIRAVAAGALMASFPLAVLAATLQRVTHHRALGGVTLAFVALGVTGVAVAVAWRLLRIARSGARGARLATGALALAVTLSAGGVVIRVLLCLGTPSAAPLVAGVLDASLGGVLLVVALIGAERAPRLASQIGAVAWACIVLLGVVIAVLQPRLCAVLSERAPVAFALGAACSG